MNTLIARNSFVSISLSFLFYKNVKCACKVYSYFLVRPYIAPKKRKEKKVRVFPNDSWTSYPLHNSTDNQ